MTQNKRNIENAGRPLFMKGEIVETSIVDISHQGKGIGKINGFPIFIDGGVIDDKVKIEITKVKKNFAFGKLMEVLEKSEFRIKPACEISQVCGGCDFMETRYDKQLEIKENFVKNSIMRIGGFAEGSFKFNSIEGLPKGDELYYRNKATLEISTGGNRLKKGGTIENLEEVKIGFKARGTHKVIHCDKCYIQHPVVSAVIKATKNFMDEDNISAWDEKWAQGLMRHMIVRVSESSKEVMVIFIINGKGIPNGEKLISIMDEAGYAEGYFLESVCVSTKKDKVKNGEIYGKKVEVYAGKPVIHDEMMGMKFEVSPRSFYQVNPKMTEKLYSKVKELVGATENDVVLDLYCGVGSIGICCATSAKYILGIERVHDAIVDANRNAVINNLVNIRFLEGKAEEVLPMLAAGYGDSDLVKLVQNANTVILDPPRAGCEKALIDSILKVSPEKIVYVSCDSATLARDLKIFAENGYELVEVSPFDMFPWSVHVETIVLVKGFAHENSLNQFAADEWNQSIIDGMYEGIDEKWMNLFSASEREKTTFFLWYDGEVHQNQKDGNDGGRWLLGYAFDTYERFREFVIEYYSMEFDNNLLKKLYTNSALSDLELAELTAGATKNGCNNLC